MPRQEDIADKLDFLTTGVMKGLTVTAKASNYTVTPQDWILISTNATAEVKFTLPSLATINGKMFIFLSFADGGFSIYNTDADKMVTMNDATTDSVSYVSAGEMIGAAAMVIVAANSAYLCELGTSTQTAAS